VAVRDGDDYIVSGTKTWTTLGQHADWIFCLVRTGAPTVKNQEAISFLLIEMNNPSITVSPIITIDGQHEVNEVHFDNIRVPADNRIGDEGKGKGWTYDKVLLTHERTGLARLPWVKSYLEHVKETAIATSSGSHSLMSDPIFAHKVAEIEMLALEFTQLRTLAAVTTGQAPALEYSILKIKGSQL
jgi:alkylation response protein AidB-like acyl-CoA dehydrogenase